MNSFRRFSRRAWLLHGYLLASMILWPVPTVRSYWTWDTNTNAKVEIANPPVGDSWWDDDSDSDGMTNAQEVAFLSDPYNRDSDHDGLTDTDERDITPAMLGGLITTDPWNWDSNGNGNSDHDEYWAWQSGLALNVSYYGQTPPSPLPTDYYRDLDGDGTFNLWDYAPTDSSVSSPPADPGSGTGTPPDPSTTDSDGDTHYDSSDSHPNTSWLWEDWNDNGTNDSQEPPPPSDSDGDSHFDTSDSHPYDPSLWEDWNWNGTNDSQEVPPTNPTDPTSPPDPCYTDSDGDSAMDANDSDPTDSSLWEDWNRNGTNDSSEPPDADGDGVTDADEYTAGTNPYFHDSDGDGLSDSEERTAQTNPLLVDTDADGLTDHEEIFIYQKNPLLARSLPGQQQIDYYQVNLADTDLDGIPNLVEAWYGRDPATDADAASDLDVDGHSDLDAYLAGWAFNVSFTSYDQDRDGITDARESYWGFNPYDPDDATQDADHDGLLNLEEIRLGLDPLSATTHGTPDLTYANTTWSLGWKACLNPGSSATTLDDDTDGDGMPDHWEHRHRLDLRDARDAIRDPDKDTLSNLTEYRFLSHPRIPKSESNTHDRTRLYATGKPLNASTTGGLMNRYRAQMAAESAAPQNVFKEFSFAAFAAWDWPDDPSNVPDNGNPIPPCPCGPKDCEACGGSGECSGCGGSGTLPCAGGHTTSCPTEVRGPCLGHGKRRCSSTHSGPCDGKHGDKPRRKFECSEHEHKPACEGDACEELEHSHENSECSQDGEGNWSCGQAGHSHTQGVCDRQVPKCGFPDHEHDSNPDSSCYVDDAENPVPITCQEEGCQNVKQYSCSNDECETAPCPGPEECDKWENEQCPTCKGTGEQSRSCSSTCTPRDCPDCADGSCIWCSGSGEDSHCSCGDSKCYCLGNDPDCPKVPGVRPPADPPPEIPYREKLKRTLSISDAAGPRYRKVGLSGLPIPDSKPQVQDESGESEEETYIDAFTRQLRHSVSDVYVHAEGSQLPLMVRRDASSEMWTAQSFESPETRPYLPFGAAWSSNICSYIRFDTECVDRDNSVEITNHLGVTLSVPIEDVSPEAQIDMAINGGLNSFDRVTTATVVDEMGSSQKYLPSAGGWIHSTEEVSDAKTSKNVFTGNVLIKKYGTTCYYEPTGISQVLGEIATPNPYVEQTNEPKKSPNIVNYARLKEVHDRHGNRLIYHYPFSNTLIPDLIYDPDRPGHSIQLVQQGGRVIQLRGPDGTIICYEYDGSCLKKVFRKVPPGQPESASVLYDYEQESRLDINSFNEAMKAMSQYELGDPRGMKAAKRIDIESHINLRGITDELGRQYIFHRAYADQDPEKPFSQAEELALKGVFPSFQGGQVQGRQEMINQFNGMTGGAFASYISPGGYSGLGGFGGGTVSSGTEYEVSMKKPRVVIAVTSPLGTTKIRSQQQQLQQLDWAAQAGRLPFDELKALALAAKSSGTAKVVNTFKALDGSVSTYTFSDPHVHSGSDHAVAIAPGYQPLPGLGLNSRSSHNITQTISYRALVIELHKDAELLSSESYAFNSDASMALASATDLSGNTTTFTYGTDGYDDPLTETSYLQQTTGPAIPVTKRFTYDDATRIMTSMTDPMGVRTEYSIETKDILLDSDGDGTGDLPFTVQGLKTAEKVLKGNTLLRETRYSYDHPKFAGLVTKQWTISPNEAVMPSSVTLTTLGDPHDGGTGTNPGWWREVTTTTGPATDAGGLDTSSPSALSSTYFAADFAGRKRSVVDPRGLMTCFDYDGAGRLTRVYHPDGSAKALGYDAHGNLTSESDGTFTGTTLQSATFTPIRTTFHRYDALNRRIKTAMDLNANGLPDWDAADYGPDDHSYTLTGSTPGTATSDPSYDGDLVSTTFYNNRNQVTSQKDARGGVITNDYDDAGRLTSTIKNGLTTTFTYDGYNNGGSIFDSSAIKPNRTTDPRGVVTTVVYDSLYRPISSTVTDPGLNGGPVFTAVTLTNYDLNGRPVQVTDPLGRVTLNEYDDLGNLTKVTEPDLTTDTSDNPTVQSYYTHHGKPWKVIDQMGNETTTRYDALGRPVEVKGPPLTVSSSPSLQVSAVTTTEYDAAGNVIAVTDPLGRVVETVYDERNRPTHVYAPTMWDAVIGQFVRPYAVTTYDALGQPTSVTDHTGATTTSHYDRAGRKWKVEAPSLPVSSSPNLTIRPTTLTYFDPGGLPVTVTNPLGQTITNTYNIHGQLIQTDDAEGIVNGFEYDNAGNRTLVRDGLGQETSFLYDGLNRLLQQTFAGGDTWQYQYNAVQKLGQLSPRGIYTSYAYDARDRLLEVNAWESGPYTLPDPAAPMPDGGVLLSRAYNYDNAGKLLTVTESTVAAGVSTPNAALSVSYTYDAMGRVTAESSSGQVHHYEYDLAGNRTKVTYSTGRIVETSYDGLNRPEAIVDGDRLTRYGYDKAGRAVILVAANGQTSQNTYDALGRLTDRTLFKTPAMSEANVLAEFSWEHDLLGNVTKQEETWPGEATRAGELRRTTMGYDDNNRLTTETIATITSSGEDNVTTAYTYDAANNRKTKTVTGGTEPGHWDYTYNQANQLQLWQYQGPQEADWKFAVLNYDLAGNRIGQSLNTCSSATLNQQFLYTAYTWDAQDRLASVTLPDGSEHRYAYDYRTRRISTGVRTPSSANETRTSIVFSGGLSVAEWEQESGTGLQPVLSAPPTVEYTRGPDMGGGVGGLLYTSRSESASASVSSSRTLRYNLSNGRGDIVAQSDSYASLTWTASYEAYGKRTKETGENKDKQRGNSKDEDPTGLLNEGFRYRDIETGVWLSRDPAGFVDGPNLYAYVKQNPWTSFDPDGLFEVGVPGVSQPIHETITRAAFAASLGISNESDFKTAMRSNPSLGVAAMAAGKGSRHHDTGKFTSATASKMATGYAADGKSGAAQAFMIDRAVQVSISHYGDGQTNHGMSPPLIPYLAIQKYSAPELAAKIKGDLNNAFDSARKNLEKGNTFAAYTTMGEMAHTMQDAYSKSHIGRDSNGRVTEFFGYQSQDGPEHAKADHVPGAKFASRPFGWMAGLANVDDYSQIKGHPGVADAMSATTSMFDAIQKGDKSAFNKLLDKTFDLAPRATTGGHGGFVKKKK